QGRNQGGEVFVLQKLPQKLLQQRLAAHHPLQRRLHGDAGLRKGLPAFRVHTGFPSFSYSLTSSPSAAKKQSSSRGLKTPHSPSRIISSTRWRGKASLYTRLQLRASYTSARET